MSLSLIKAHFAAFVLLGAVLLFFLGSAPAGLSVSTNGPGSSGGVELGFRVHAASGEVVSGAVATILELSSTGPRPLAPVTTDQQGRGRIAISGGAALLLSLRAEGKAPLHVLWSPAEWDREADFQLPDGLSFRFRLQGSLGPVPGASVSVWAPGALLPEVARSDAEGWVTVTLAARAPCRVQVRAAGFAPVDRMVDHEGALQLEAAAGGRVVVLMASGAPAPGAIVWLTGDVLWPPRRVEAGPDGVLWLRGLAPGIYDLRAVRGTELSPTLRGVSLTGEAQPDLVLRLRPGRMQRVRLFHREGGAELPIAGGRVTLAEGGISAFPISTVTDAEGWAVVGPFEGGRAQLHASAPGYVSAGAIPVTEGASPMEVRLVRAGRVRVSVRDEHGGAVAGATLAIIGNDRLGNPVWLRSSATQQAGEALAGWAGTLIPQGELGITLGPVPPIPGASLSLGAVAGGWATEADGTALLEGVPPGRMQLRSEATGWLPTLSAQFFVEEGAESEVALVLRAGQPLTIRVVDDRRAPVAGAWVALTGEREPFGDEGKTGPDGEVAFAATPSRLTAQVSQLVDGSMVVHRRAVPREDWEKGRWELELPAPRGEALLLVQDGDGNPLPRAQLTFLSLDVNEPRRQTHFSDDAGRVRLPAAVGLRAQLRWSAEGQNPLQVQVDALPEESTYRLTMPRAVGGRVTRVRGRQPAEGAVVVAELEGERWSTRTDERGEYEFAAIPVGQVHLTVSLPDHVTARGRHEITAGDGVLELAEVDLLEGVTLSGWLRNPEGQPVEGARLSLTEQSTYLPVGGLPEGTVQTDADGHFVLPGVPAELVVVHAYAAQGGRGSWTVDAGDSGQRETLALVLEGGSEAPATGAGVALTLEEGDGGVVVRLVAEGGEAERAGVRSGDRLLRVDGEEVTSLSTARTALQGPEGSDLLLDLEREGAALQLRLRREALRH